MFTSHLLPGCLLCETEICCRAVNQVDEHAFVVRYGAKRCYCVSEIQQSFWSNVTSSISVYFNGNTDAGEN